MSDLRTPLLAELREIAALPVPAFDPDLADDYARSGRRLPYEVQYFARRRHLAALALVGEGPALSSLLKDVCQERSWALPAHWDAGEDPRTCVDLFACETAQTLAEILRLREDVDGADQVEAEVRERVLDPLFESDYPFAWEEQISNWTAVCAGAAGMAALALEYDLEAIRGRILPALQSYLFSFGPDGGCVEGVDYWVYGFGYFTYFAEAWRAATGEDLLAGHEAIAAFPARAQLYPGSFATFGDTGSDSLLPAGLLTRLHDRLDAPLPAGRVQDFSDDSCARWAHLTRTLDWGRPLAEAVDEGRALLPDVGWFVERRHLGRRTWALAVKGGYNDEPHNHLDLGSFLIAVDGEQLLCDPGAGEYTAAYFGPERYDQVHPSAAWHSVPAVEGAAQQFGEDSRAELVGTPDGVEAYIDAYGEAALIRRFTWNDDGIALEDLGPDLTETLVSRIRPELDGDRAVWAGERGTLVLHGVNPDDALVDSVDTTDHRGAPDRLWALRFGLRGGLRFELL